MEAAERKTLKKFSAQLRIDQLEMFKQRGMGHIGGCLSVTELISVLYGKQMKYDPANPDWKGRDYLVMSRPMQPRQWKQHWLKKDSLTNSYYSQWIISARISQAMLTVC